MTNSHIALRMTFIGDICIQWANIEYQVAHIIWCILNLKPDVGKMVTGGLDMQPRLNVAILLAKQLNTPPYLIDGLVGARSLIQGGMDLKRNRAVHGITFFSPDHTSAKVELHRGKGPKTPVEFSNVELDAFRLELSDLGTKLNTLYQKISNDTVALAEIDAARKMR